VAQEISFPGKQEHGMSIPSLRNVAYGYRYFFATNVVNVKILLDVAALDE
jgi:hypothetical protein